MKAVALVVAGGRGTRLGGAIPKQFLRLGKLPLLVYALRTFQRSRQIAEVVLVTPQGFVSRAMRMVRSYSLSKVRRVVVGGKERQDSVLLGLRAVPEDADFVLIHDAARPGVTPRLVEGSIRLAKAKKAGVLVAIPVADTLKRVEGKEVFATLDRAVLWRAQTPQVFPYPAVLEACERAARQGFKATDDSAVFQWAGGRVHVLQGEETNLKVTTRQDLAIAQRLLFMGRSVNRGGIEP